MSRNANALPIILASALLVGGVALFAYERSVNNQQQPPNNTIQQSQQPSASELPGATCRMQGLLPDASCTPGAINPNVTQDTIAQTICVSGYTKTIRPSVTYTNKLKIQQMQEYGFTDSIHLHEEDHLISLELGGSPSDPKNLWPEPGNSPNPKDKIENFLHSAVCAGRISLQEVQTRIATDWTTAENGLK